MLPVGLFRTLLWCYPAPFRHEYGAEMTGAFAEQVREARQQGGWRSEASIWIRALFDVFVIAPREHAHVIQQDLRYAIRTLVSRPGFAAIAVLSLALGIGANTAIFSLINSVLLSALPVHDPESLVILTNPASNGITIGGKSGEREELTYAEFRQLRELSSVFTSLMACQTEPERVPVRGEGAEMEETLVELVSAKYFSTLGVPALLGRTLNPDDDPDAANAVISYDYWQRRLGGRADVVGSRITIRQGVFSIIGVAPASFFGETVGQRPEIWAPIGTQPIVLPGRDWLHENPGDEDKVMWLHAFGRLKPGVRMETAQAAANVTFQRGLAAFYYSAERAKGQWLKLRPAAKGASPIRGQFAEPLTMLLLASGLVLLIACANLGNLLLTRTTARIREMSVRLALGAGRGRIIRQLLTESMVVAVLGGVAGLGAAWILRTVLVRLVSGSIPLPATPDARVLGFAFGLTLVAGLILGLLPALRMMSVHAGAGLKEQGRGATASAAWRRAGKFVVVGQVALSVPLLVGAGLLLRTLENLQRVDLGYAKDRLLLMRVDVQMGGYQEQQRLPLFQRLLDRIRAVPGVRAASYSKSGLFLGSRTTGRVNIEGYTAEGRDGVKMVWDHAGPEYFSTLGIPLLVGREITERDQPTSNKVCVINEALARRYFAGRSPLGMHIDRYEIVGVARDSRSRNLRDEVEPRFYVPAAQPTDVPRFITFVVRTAAEPSGVLGAVRQAILAEDRNLPITAASTLTELVDRQMVQDRLLARLSTAFGVVGLFLAAIGLYGVVSYGVARRTNEIGIRKALGAADGAVMAMILRETALLLAVGLVSGVAVYAAGIRLLTSRLYGLTPTDPVALGASITVLTGVAFLAAWFPAYRASRVDPLVALRYE
ncbi:MAG TPA: ABC transporter permease [Bryobacteraceae bacterium]